jgi:transposase
MDDDECPKHGWGPRGQRVFGNKPGFAKNRVSFLSGLHVSQLCSPIVIEGYCTREIVEYYFESVLLPKIGRGKTIVLDNASYHKGGRLREIVEKAGCKLLYLPPYSPDLNDIEHFWFPVKHAIRNLLPTLQHDIWLAAQECLAKMCKA